MSEGDAEHSVKVEVRVLNERAAVIWFKNF